MGRILDEIGVEGSDFHLQSILKLIQYLQVPMGCMLDKLSNRRQEEYITIDYSNFGYKLDAFIADDVYNIDGRYSNNQSVLDELYNQKIAR